MSQSRTETAPPASSSAGSANGTKSGTLAVAGVSGLLASACCVGPLALASVGVGSIAAGVVATFEPLRPVFIVIAFAALGFGWWRIVRHPVAECAPGAACATPQTDRTYKTVFWVVAAIVLALITFPYYVALFY